MTDLTTRPTAADPSAAASTAAQGTGVAVTDRRTLRHITRAEQRRLSADADLERRARAAQLELELREQRQAAARREREADAADKHARAEQRRRRRTARQTRLYAAAPRWAERALFVLPIMFPMAVAWVGQIRFAMTVMGWPVAAAVVFAAGFELSTAYVARLDWLSRAAGDSALLFRGATWAFAAGAATMNYWHAAGPGFAPNGEAVSYGLMSITGVVLWELLSIYRHRTALRAEGKLPSARPRFGVARRIRFRGLTGVASLLALRDGHPTVDLAWDAAIRAIDTYGSASQARKAIRAGRPVPRPESAPDIETGEADRGRDNGAETSDLRDGKPDVVHRDCVEHEALCPVAVSETAPVEAEADAREEVPTDRPHEADEALVLGVSDDSDSRPRTADVAVRAQMEAFARASLDAGDPITGADLDRRFGTRDYGRKVLRRLADATGRSPAVRLKNVVTPVGAGQHAETP